MLIRQDTAEIVRQEKVTGADRQKLFPLDIKKPKENKTQK
jgi:hypothetical protein